MRAKPPEDVLHDECLTFLSKHLFKEPRHRHDVIHRKVLNQTSVPTVVKTTWNSLCHPAAKLLQIDSVLCEVNKAITEAYLLANIHVVRLCSEGLPIPPLNQTFFYQCLSAVSLADKKKPEQKSLEFRASVSLYRSFYPPYYELPDSRHLSSGWYQQASQQMATACKNSTSTNFYRRFRRYLKLKYDLDGKSAYEALKAIQAVEYDGQDEIVARYRKLMPTKPKYGQVEDDPELVMPLQYTFLCFFEQFQTNERVPNVVRGTARQARLFSLVPTKSSFTCNHLKMCTNGLYGLLKRSGVTGMPRDGAPFREVADTYWRRFFRISDFETANRKFAGEVVLDGKGVSIVLRKPRPVCQSTKAAAHTYYIGTSERWGLDPGRRDLFVASNQHGDIQRCSTRQFYHESGYKYSTKKIRTWQDKHSAVKEAIHNMPSKKTSRLDLLQKHISFLLPRLDMLTQFHLKKGFRDLKFTRYVLAQKKLLKICRQLTKASGRATTVGFGDWSNKDDGGIIKKSPAGPVKRLERQLSNHCQVVPVDEFRSSKLCHRCHGCTENMRCEKVCADGVSRRVKVHSVLFCRNSKSCHGMTMNRDVNASRNILRLLEAGTDRPLAFRREVLSCTLHGPKHLCTNAPWGLQGGR